MSNLTATSPNQITFLADTARHRNRFDIPSSDGSKTYRVAQAQGTGEWQCSCPAWIYAKGGRKPCKHLRAMSDLLLQIEGKAPAAAAIAAAPAASAPAPHPFVKPAAAKAAPAAAPVSGRDAARQTVEALAAQAEAEVAALRSALVVAEAKAKAFRAAAEAA